jgi:hypothetical protein
LGVRIRRGCASQKGKGQVEHDLAPRKKPSAKMGQLSLVYFEYPCVELEVVVVMGASFFCAHAPKLKALAKTATIIIAFKNFNLYRLLSQQVAVAL